MQNQAFPWVRAFGVAVLGLVALYMASHSKEMNFYEIGLGLAAACTLFIFFMIKTYYDEQ